jgi:peptidoglycan/LPS O-acetylase OafA/YrhL
MRQPAKDSANLDFLRAVAVSCVFFAHLNNMATSSRGEISWHFGQMGVLLFFVHTSFVLMQSLERLKCTGAGLFSSFYIRRWFRIYPLSILFVLTAYVFSVSPEGDTLFRHQWSFKELTANLTLTQNLTYNMVDGLWTLPLEVQMYLVLPLLYIVLRKRPLLWVAVLCVLAIPAGVVQPMVSGRLNILSYVPCFLGGVVAWQVANQVEATLPGWMWPLALMAAMPVWLFADRRTICTFDGLSA